VVDWSSSDKIRVMAFLAPSHCSPDCRAARWAVEQMRVDALWVGTGPAH
jgi:hypothetical protein